VRVREPLGARTAGTNDELVLRTRHAAFDKTRSDTCRRSIQSNAANLINRSREGDVAGSRPATTTDEVFKAAKHPATARFISSGTWKWTELHMQTSGKPQYRYLRMRIDVTSQAEPEPHRDRYLTLDAIVGREGNPRLERPSRSPG
jgi:hypothetical protein